METVRVDYGGGVEKFVHLSNVAEVNVTPAREAGWDEEMGERIYASPMAVEIVYTAPDSVYEDGGDYPDRARVETRPYTVTLYRDEAERFLKDYHLVRRGRQ